MPRIECVFRVDRLSNLFHFVNNLAAWHFACREEYNRAWLAETGELTAPERVALDGFAAVAREFPYGDRWLGRAFIPAETPDEAWEQARELIGLERVAIVRSVFETLGPRFDRIWERDLPRLRELPPRLQPIIDSPGVAEAVRALEGFYGTAFPRLIVHLLISRGKNITAGGANEGPGHITLEVLETEDLLEGVETILHEGSHLMERARFEPMFREFSRRHGLEELKGDRGWDAHHLLREALTGALAPDGCLSQKLGRGPYDHRRAASRFQARGDLQRASLAEMTARVLPLVERYIQDGRPVDRELLDEAYAAYAANLPRF
ncbi:MAG: hypothetical protein ACYC9Q_11880 [Bacillota bacterium]